MSDSGGPSKRMRYCDQVQEPELLEELCDIDVDSLGSSSDNSAVVDESFFDAETVILEWDFPLFEAVVTDRCAKVRSLMKSLKKFWRHIFAIMLLEKGEFPLPYVIGVCVSLASFILELLVLISI
jgi:hypothetical protein